MSRPQMELSGTQVVASLLAALTGAIAASFLGVAGTIIGTAVMSLAGTAGAAVYRHYLARSKERLHAAAAAAKTRHTGQTGQHGAGGPGQPPVDAASTARDPASAAWGSPGRTPDPASTARDSGLTRDRARRTSIADPGEAASEPFPRAGGYPGAWPADLTASHNGRRDGRDDALTRTLPGPHGRGPAPARGPAGGSGDSADLGDLGDSGDREHPGARRRRWLILAGSAVALFLVVMASVTVVELIAGKPLNALLTGSSGSGTSVGHVFGGRATPATPPSSRPTTPATSQQPTSTPTPASSSPTQSSSATPTPSSSASAPTPSAGSSGSPGPSSSPKPAVTASQSP